MMSPPDRLASGKRDDVEDNFETTANRILRDLEKEAKPQHFSKGDHSFFCCTIIIVVLLVVITARLLYTMFVPHE